MYQEFCDTALFQGDSITDDLLHIKLCVLCASTSSAFVSRAQKKVPSTGDEAEA